MLPGPPTSWRECVELPVASIGTAAKSLRDIQRNWAMYAPLHHRRAALIQERLPHVSAKPVVFPAAAPTAPLGSWTLFAPDRLLAAARMQLALRQRRGRAGRGQGRPAQSRLPETLGSAGAPAPLAAAGRALPRSRRLAGRLDLGAGASLGAQVVAIDKAPLDPKVAAMPGVEWRGESAFALDPDSVGAGRLAVLRHHLLSGAAVPAGRALACERAGEELRLHHQIPGRDRSRDRRGLRGAPGATVLHLHNNKHELTFLLTGPLPG